MNSTLDQVPSTCNSRVSLCTNMDDPKTKNFSGLFNFCVNPSEDQTEIDHKDCMLEEVEFSSPQTKKLKRSSSSSSEIHESDCDVQLQEQQIEVCLETDRTSDPQLELCLEGDGSESPLEGQSAPMSSEVEVGSNSTNETNSDCSIPLFDFSREVRRVFKEIFTSINHVITKPTVTIAIMQEYVSRKREFITIPTDENPPNKALARLEMIRRIACKLRSRKLQQMEALRDPETESEEEENLSETIESESNKEDRKTYNKILDLHLDLAEDLKMLMNLAKLILREYSQDSVGFVKIFDYILCFEIMKEEYSEKVDRFLILQHSIKNVFCEFESALLHVEYLMKVIDGYISEVQYGVFLIKIHEKFRKVKHVSSNIKQMAHFIKFR